MHDPKAWITKAEEDLAAAEIMLRHGDNVLGVAGYHSQQAAEKYLKAVLVHEKTEPPRIHDLGQLLARIGDHSGATAEHLVKDASWLALLAVETRYPDIPAAVCTRERAERALDIARRIRLSASKGYAPMHTDPANSWAFRPSSLGVSSLASGPRPS